MIEERSLYDKENILFEEPLEDIKARLGEAVNRARWTGNWEDVPGRSLRKRYDDVPLDIKERFNEIYAGIDKHHAYSYQKFDASLAALRKTCILTHNMGLGKTRIAILGAEAIGKPTLITALPRLVRQVWANEFQKMGIDDWIILERPKRNRQYFLRASSNKNRKVEKYRGTKGIGVISGKAESREQNTTSDVRRPSRYKIVSYNLLLPYTFHYDYVICPECGIKHNRESCPGVRIFTNVRKGKYDHRTLSYRDLSPPIAKLVDSYVKGKINLDLLESELRPEVDNFSSVSPCRHSLKGSNCLHCGGVLGKLNKTNEGYYPTHSCLTCGYVARVWLPPMTRRLKGRFDVMIVDESQAVKNRSSLRTKYTLSLRPRYRLMTTGTPATADLTKDLYPQLRWLLGYGFLFPYASEKAFTRNIGVNARDDMDKLHKLLDPIQIRRDTDDYGVSSELLLPPVRERRLSIPMSAHELESYRRAEDNVREWLKEIKKDETSELDFFSKMWILRRAACVPWIDNPDIKKSTKIEALKVEVNHLLLQGRKILIGTELLDMLDAIEEAFPGTGRIEGSTNIKESDRIISLFQDVCPDCQISLVEDGDEMVCPLCEKKYDTPRIIAVSRNTVKAGVTLNKASVVIFTDPAWTYADMWQFWKRAHRIGSLYEYLDVIYMESADTIESRMYDTAESRKASILKAINRKDVGKTTKINIKNFVSELLGVTLTGDIERRL